MDEAKAELVVEEGAEKGRVLPLRASKVIEIGREGNLRLEDKGLSRHHCRIFWEEGSYRVEDLGSTWGTFVNGEKVRSYVLANGDRIKVGSHVLLFSAPEEEQMVELVPEEEQQPILDATIDVSTVSQAPRAAAAVPVDDDAPITGDATGDDLDEPVVPGQCANCGKPAERDEKISWEAEAAGLPARDYCSSCREQYPQLGRILANHLCEKVLGAGGMGIVYRGLHVVMGRRAALKTLRVLSDADPVMVKRLLREATAGGRIQHPNIVSVHDTGEQEQVAYVVMEYVRGENLAEALRREKKFPIARAVSFGIQAADALAAGFKLGYIHRDIKPENILLTAGDRVKVTDFGLAKNLKEGELGGLTKTGQVLGTMVYMPPEQIVSSKGSDQRADIYSLGATIFHLAAGRPPFDSRSAITLLMQIRTEPAPLLSSVVSGVPTGVDRVVDRCLRKDPAERYQAPDELAAELRAARAALR